MFLINCSHLMNCIKHISVLLTILPLTMNPFFLRHLSRLFTRKPYVFLSFFAHTWTHRHSHTIPFKDLWEFLVLLPVISQVLAYNFYFHRSVCPSQLDFQVNVSLFFWPVSFSVLESLATSLLISFLLPPNRNFHAVSAWWSLSNN